MDIRPIRNEDDYREALRQAESLMSSGAGTPEGDILDVLATLVKDYERRTSPLEDPDPVEVMNHADNDKGHCGQNDGGEKVCFKEMLIKRVSFAQ